MNFSRFLKQTATLWTAGALDGYGNPSWTKSTVSCRWEDGIKLVKDDEGNEVVSTATVWLSQDVSTGDFLYLGTSGGSSPPVNAREVITFLKTPSISSTQYERKAMVE